MFLVLVDLLKRKFLSLSGIPVVIEKLGWRFRSLKSWSLYALISGIYRVGEEVRYQYETESGVNRFDPTSGYPLGYNTKDNLIDNYLNEVIQEDIKASTVLENLLQNWRSVDFYRKSGIRLWGVLNLVNPAFWLTLKPLFRYDEYLWECIAFAHSCKNVEGTHEVLNDLRSLSIEPNILDIDFSSKVAVSGLRRKTWDYFWSLDIQTQDALSYWVAFKSNVQKWHDIQSGVRPPEKKTLDGKDILRLATEGVNKRPRHKVRRRSAKRSKVNSKR